MKNYCKILSILCSVGIASLMQAQKYTVMVRNKAPYDTIGVIDFGEEQGGCVPIQLPIIAPKNMNPDGTIKPGTPMSIKPKQTINVDVGPCCPVGALFWKVKYVTEQIEDAEGNILEQTSMNQVGDPVEVIFGKTSATASCKDNIVELVDKNGVLKAIDASKDVVDALKAAGKGIEKGATKAYKATEKKGKEAVEWSKKQAKKAKKSKWNPKNW